MVVSILSASFATFDVAMARNPDKVCKKPSKCVDILFGDLPHFAIVVEYVLLEFNTLRAGCLSGNNRKICARPF